MLDVSQTIQERKDFFLQWRLIFKLSLPIGKQWQHPYLHYAWNQQEIENVRDNQKNSETEISEEGVQACGRKRKA